MIGVKRKLLVGPFRQNRRERPALKPLVETDGKALEYALPRETGRDGGGGIVHDQPPFHLDLDGTAITLEFPGERSPGLRVAKEDAIVVHQVVGRDWNTVTVEIA